MYLSAYHFNGDPTELTAACERTMSHFPADSLADTLLLQVFAVGETGVTVIDACPDKATHEQFVVSPEFRGALVQAGLSEPRVEVLGDVAHAFVRPDAVTLVGSTVTA